MNKASLYDVVYTHTEGEPTCIIRSGVAYPPDTDILQKRQYIQDNYDWLRLALMREPRGHRDMYGVFVTPPSSVDADAGMVWVDGENYHDMCGHGTIALGMVMVSLGMVRSVNGKATIRFETTAGSVVAEVASNADSVEWCRFQNVPAFLVDQDVPVDLPEVGRVSVDIVFGGNYFAIVQWDSPRYKIRPENGSFFSHLGLMIKEILREKLELRHPTQHHITHLDHVTFYHEATRPEALYRCVHVFSDGKMDRSPGGTGTSAMMAMLEAKGRLEIGRPIRSEGLLGSGTFEGCLIGETNISGRRAVIPTIKGKAEITGYAKWLINPDDPVGGGFVIT